MKIALIGYGKMGKMIEQIAISKGHTISYKIDIDNAADLKLIKPSNTDVAIEFTTPHSAFENVKSLLNNGVAVVCGSTGWHEQLPEAQKLCKEKGAALLWTSNFSIGVNLFFKLNEQLAKLMNGIEGYEPVMTEIHHIHKKDAPSGTAITLAEGLLKHYKKFSRWILKPKYLRETDKKDALVIESRRKSEVPGTHIIQYNSNEDYINITHFAKGRKGLALGAVIAAEYIKGKKGIFSMNDVLSF